MKHQNHFQKDLPRGLSIFSTRSLCRVVEIESPMAVKGVQHAVK